MGLNSLKLVFFEVFCSRKYLKGHLIQKFIKKILKVNLIKKLSEKLIWKVKLLAVKQSFDFSH